MGSDLDMNQGCSQSNFWKLNNYGHTKQNCVIFKFVVNYTKILKVMAFAVQWTSCHILPTLPKFESAPKYAIWLGEFPKIHKLMCHTACIEASFWNGLSYEDFTENVQTFKLRNKMIIENCSELNKG